MPLPLSIISKIDFFLLIELIYNFTFVAPASNPFATSSEIALHLLVYICLPSKFKA